MISERDEMDYGISFGGEVLDGCPAEFLTFENLNDISTILGYRYDDGKWWHDQTCVLEIIFYSYQENIEGNRIRILYNFPSDLIQKLFQLTRNGTCCMRSIKLDLGGYCVPPENDDENVSKEDFDIFNCRIQHKKHFYIKNPEMPDD